MPFRKVTITNFQSIAEAELDLGRFTVVTGPTGSGKSAVIRAIRLACFNRRGSDFVRRGAQSCMVQLGVIEPDLKDGWAAGIERAASGTSKDCYAVAPWGNGDPVIYTKLGGTVPESVSKALRMSALNFAGQHDPLFLLADSGSEVARTLGELTNVTLIFEAAREAVRRRQAIAADLKRAQASLAQLKEQAQQYRNLKAQREALAQAEEALAAVQAIESRAAALRSLSGQLSLAQRQAAATAAVLARHDVPSLEQLDALTVRAARVRVLMAADADASGEAAAQQFRAQQAAQAEAALHDRLHQVLLDAGQCPTCGQKIDPMSQLAVTLFGDGH